MNGGLFRPQAIYRTPSPPFDKGSTWRVRVKIIGTKAAAALGLHQRAGRRRDARRRLGSKRRTRSGIGPSPMAPPETRIDYTTNQRSGPVQLLFTCAGRCKCRRNRSIAPPLCAARSLTCSAKRCARRPRLRPRRRRLRARVPWTATSSAAQRGRCCTPRPLTSPRRRAPRIGPARRTSCAASRRRTRASTAARTSASQSPPRRPTSARAPRSPRGPVAGRRAGVTPP